MIAVLTCVLVTYFVIRLLCDVRRIDAAIKRKYSEVRDVQDRS
jgi:hypothetical protein